MRDRVHFLAAFLKRPFDTGSVTPSSRHLAEAMVEGMDLENADAVVELGPGTGVFTRVISDRLKAGARLTCFEMNPEMAHTLAQRFPRAEIVNDSAENLESHLQRVGQPVIDYVVSGLPWALFPLDRQQRLLDAAVRPLKSGGRFTTFTYLHASILPAGRALRMLLESRFSEVRTSRTVWRNFPPAFVYRCRK